MKKAGVSALHSTHCLGNGDIMISSIGDTNGNSKGMYVFDQFKFIIPTSINTKKAKQVINPTINAQCRYNSLPVQLYI